jgi:FG-GAP repeat
MRLVQLFLSVSLAGLLSAQQALSTTFGPTPGGLTGSAVAVGTDFDGDAMPDLLVASPGIGQGVVQVVSGATNSVRTIGNPGAGTFPFRVMIGVPDLDLDGRGDILLDSNGSLRAYSGATLVLRWATPAVSYEVAAPVGDRNGDGRGDLAAITLGNPGELRLLSGLDGAVFAVYPLPFGGGNALVNIGDQNGDGVPELARLLTAGTQILRLANPPELLTIQFGGVAIAAANVASNQRQEVLVGEPFNQQVRAYDANSGALLRTWGPVHEGRFAVVGDLDLDGVPELALRTNSYEVRFVSGSSGAELARWPASAQFRPEQLAGGVDFNGDGFGDLLIGASLASANGSSPGTGGWQRLSGKILAVTELKPVNCAQGPWAPQLGATRPVLGATMTVAGSQAPLLAVGTVVWSLRPPLPVNLGVAGCDAWFDLGGGQLLTTTTAANWQISFPLPLVPQIAGLPLALQAFYGPTSTPIGLDLSNGIWARVGW